MQLSPSSRRAWIEIFSGLYSLINGLVALLAEGVDRNKTDDANIEYWDKSPSSRRAWIEI